MRAPFILNESRAPELPGDINLFESLDALRGHVEPIDVEHGEYVAFDAEGRPLVLSTDGREITVAEAAGGSARPGDLAALLRSYLASARYPDGRPAATDGWREAATLEQLLARAVDVTRTRRPAPGRGLGTRLVETARRWFAPG
jgi:hypothetical protein